MNQEIEIKHLEAWEITVIFLCARKSYILVDRYQHFICKVEKSNSRFPYKVVKYLPYKRCQIPDDL